MIKLFRNIRARLIHEGRLTKYLLYAGGEIILVVIGILLALQINSWNQARVNATTEAAYYQRFLDDVLLDEELITQQASATKERLHGANMLIEALQKEDVDMDVIALAIGKSVSRSDFGLNPTQTTFEDIKSSGNIQLIKDLKLRKQLDDYYAFMNGLMTTINSNASGLGPRMYGKEDVIGTGYYHLAIRQNALDSSMVDIKALDKISNLTSENKMLLMNDAVYYAGITSRNLVHFATLKEKVDKMKMTLEKKCNN